MMNHLLSVHDRTVIGGLPLANIASKKASLRGKALERSFFIVVHRSEMRFAVLAIPSVIGSFT